MEMCNQIAILVFMVTILLHISIQTFNHTLIGGESITELLSVNIRPAYRTKKIEILK